MAINRDFIGRSYRSSTSYLVGREKVREFATAIGDNNPVFHDVEVARSLGYPDLVAPPTFAFVITYRAMIETIGDPALNLDYGRVVHGEEHFTYTRPLFVGDEVVVDSTIDDIATAGRNELINLRQDLLTVDGELIASTSNITVSRGTAPESEA
ncbi:MAG: MaoC family dehydratase N-terminal domain-containing protein [Actinomycetes bacterium]